MKGWELLRVCVLLIFISNAEKEGGEEGDEVGEWEEEWVGEWVS